MKIAFSKVFFVTCFVSVIFCSCSSHRGMQSPSSVVEFKKDNFEFSEQLSATASTARILGIDWNTLFYGKKGDFSNSIITPSIIPLSDSSVNKAVYKLMEQNPGYDVVFYPSVKSTKGGIPFIFMRYKTTVNARLAKIK
ncbi:hypothetical protein LJC54_01155 [Parabacteroides sp. OttesenSCG-928-J18]|nr:hypothetical protein [Parabacteroides sp. OttesenSCG-928-J18]